MEIEARQIRAVAMCLFRNNGKLLVSRSGTAGDPAAYCRPLGGGIEFGETGRDAVVRETREEIGAEIEQVTSLGTLENIFTENGRQHHQIVLLFEAKFVDHSLYNRSTFDRIDESGAEGLLVEWRSLAQLESGEVRFVPLGLMPFLVKLGWWKN